MPRMLFLARHSGGVEPLGLHYLSQIPLDMGWECAVVLIKGDDFEPLYKLVRESEPDLVGCHIWTGFHKPMLEACDWLRARDIPVVMGGPHATYSHEQCLPHADWIIRGSGFGYLREVIEGTLEPGVHFNAHGRHEMFPIPSRRVIYDAYPEFARSRIKSHFASVGCPYHCTYCYADEFNRMHGGFDLVLRSIDDVISEAQTVMNGWPETRLFYFQDDVFGFKLTWLEEFARRWKLEVGVPFHCQMRLEMTRHSDGDRRLDLFAEAGCTGITLAIESGNAFLRKEVLFRAMPHELIVEGCRKIMLRGMSLRTEQILAVPFSNIETDLSTCALNREINPTHAWASILSPYPFVNIGRIATAFGLHSGGEDDLEASFFERSVMRHVAGGPHDIEKIVQGLPKTRQREPLLRMKAEQSTNGHASIYYHPDAREKSRGDIEDRVGEITYLSDSENEAYCEKTARLHRLFNWLPRLPLGEELGATLVNLGNNAWNWEGIGQATKAHLSRSVPDTTLKDWEWQLAREMGFERPDHMPLAIKQNPHYFTHFTAGGTLAKTMLQKGLFAEDVPIAQTLAGANNTARENIFTEDLYKLGKGPVRIAKYS